MTTTDMKAALQACVDAMLHDGVPTDPEHPKRIDLDSAEAALAGQSAGVPAGYALVPIEPTSQQLEGMCESYWGDGWDDEDLRYARIIDARNMYKAGLAAAPAPVSETTGEMTVTEALMRDLLTHGIAIHRIAPADVFAEPAPVSEPAPYSAPFTTDVPHCCGEPSTCKDPCGDSDFESDKPIPIVTYDDGARVILDSWTGGAHESGVFGEVALRFIDAHGVETVREYCAKDPEQPSERGERPIEPEDIDAVAEAIQRETSVEWLIASRAAVAAIDTLIARGNHASEHGEQDCPHGVDDGACKQCYGEAVRGSCPDGSVCEIGCFGECEKRAASAPTLSEQHTDDLAVDSFARAMKEKMAAARAKGRSGWEGTEPAELSRMLREHVEKGDPRDVANFCMMLWHHSSQIVPQPQAAEPKGLSEPADHTEADREEG